MEQTPELANITEDDYKKILFDWNNTYHPYPHHETLHGLFEIQAKKTPDAIAIHFEEKTCTYQALDQWSTQLAHKIQTLIKKDDSFQPKDTLIALFLDRSIEMMIGVLAILKAGAAYVPIDPSFPKERINYILNDTETPLILTQTHYIEKLKQLSPTQSLCIDRSEHYLHESTQPLTPQSTAENLAYVMYTSGTTGQPKGVALPHTGIVNRIHWMQRYYPLTANDRVLQKTPYGFDVSVWELFWAHQVGASLVIAKPQGHQDPLYLFELIETKQVTTLHFVPSMLTAFNHLLQETTRALPSSIRLIFCSGEALSAHQVHTLYHHAQHPVALHNLYGPTEASIDVSFFPCPPTVDRVLIGKPIQNMQLYLLNEHKQPVPIGVEGEIYIGGVGLAREYLNQPKLTEERFIDNPFPFGSKKLYKTGDLGKWTPSGDIDYLGRNDFQLKIRGYRVELNEIEHHLSQYPNIQQCAVLPVQNAHDELQLIAYYLSDTAVDSHALRSFLKEYLPNYMIPNQYIHQTEFPLSTNGKLDRKALLSCHSEPLSSSAPTAPKTALEQTLVTIWSKILKIDTIGVYDSFFSLGGHSLSAAQIIILIQEYLNKDLSIQTFYELDHIAALATHLEEKTTKEKSTVTLPDFSKECLTKHKKLPLTDFQLILWLCNLFEPKAKKMNIVSRKRIQGQLDLETLKRSFIAVIDQQEALLYHIDFFFPTQKKYKNSRQIFKLFSSQLLSHPEPEKILDQSFKQLLTIYPWPKKHPLILAKVFYLKNNEMEIQLCMPHLIADEHSMDTLWDTLSTHYIGKEPSSPITFNSSFKHYLFEEYQQYTKNKAHKQHFWKAYLKTAELFIFPHTAILSTKKAKHHYSQYTPLPEDLFDGLKRYCDRHKINASHLLSAALIQSLWEHMTPKHKKTTQSMLINFVKSTRENPKYDRTIGCFVRVDPIKVQMNQPSLQALAYAIHEEIQNTMPEQQFSSLEKFACFSNCFKRKSYFKAYMTKTVLPLYLLILKCFNIQNANKNALKLCWKLAAFKRKNFFLVNLNIWNNFFNPSMHTDNLFGQPTIKTSMAEIELSNLNDIVDVCFLRDEGLNAPYLVISSNLTSAFKQSIAQRFIDLLNAELG